MPNGYALCIGINEVNPEHYQGWKGALTFCEKDALAIEHLLQQQGFQQVTTLLTQQATSANVLQQLQRLGATAHPNDLVVIYYSGHGGSLPDENADEDDGQDETWCLYDRQLLDDELWLEWSRFQPGVRILLVSDSCHSQSIAKDDGEDPHVKEAMEIEAGAKFLPIAKAADTYFKNKVFYDQLAKETPAVNPENIGAHIRVLAGCEDNARSYKGKAYSLFTEALLQTWNNGAFDGDYNVFHKKIKEAVGGYKGQHPQFTAFGAPDALFDQLKPFQLI